MKIKLDENQRGFMTELFIAFSTESVIGQLEDILNESPEDSMLELKGLFGDIKVAFERDAEKVKNKLEV